MNDIQVSENGTTFLKNAWAGGIDFGQFSNIDLNFDGEDDLFVFDRTCDKVLTFIHKGGAGSTEYDYAPEYEALFPSMRSWSLLVDYNCDGLEDIFTYTLGTVKIFKNVGNRVNGHSFIEESPFLRTTTFNKEVFMYFASNDIPTFVDIDNDSDIDVLSFGVRGLSLEYHKNMSMETYGVCDSLLFVTENLCWGRFRESGATNEVVLWDTLVYPCDGSYPTPEFSRPGGAGEDRHAGSTVLALDMNANGVMDIILGDVSYNNLVMLMNSGTAPNLNSGMISQDINYPSTSVSANLEVFPAAFHVDVDADGKRDLVVGVNNTINALSHRSVWYYNNENTDDFPDFKYKKEDFLQDEMIETGSGSLPVFFDHNGDGLKDLLVSQHTRYNDVTGLQESFIQYYENTGTSTSPEFTLVTDDYMNLSTLSIGAGLSFYPTFGDLDDDGDEDMILGEYLGYCYQFENSGGAGNEAIFTTFDTLRNTAGEAIFNSTYAYPTIIDLDRDGDLDVVIGRRTGKLQYFKNTGTVSAMQLEWETDNLGNVDVSEFWSREGQAIPVFIDTDGEYNLVLGSKTGYLHYYDKIEGNLAGNFNLVDSTLDNINIGTWSAPAIADLNGDNTYDMMLGNRRGGLGLYVSADISKIGINESKDEIEISVFPNPASDFIVVEGNLDNEFAIECYTLEGKLVYSVPKYKVGNQLNVSTLKTGIYMLKIKSDNSFTEKVLTITR